MSGKMDKRMRKVAKEMREELLPELINNTNAVIVEMQANWDHDSKVQFCRWFMGLDTEEQLWDTLYTPEERARIDAANSTDGEQLEFDFEKGHDDEVETESDTGSAETKGTIQ